MRPRFVGHKVDVRLRSLCVNTRSTEIERAHFLIAVAVSLLAVGCRHVGDTAGPKPSWLDPAAAPPDAAQLRYLVDRDTGRVFMEVPPAVLANVRVQLVTTGNEEVARQIGRLYDLQTGRVRDPAHAKAADRRAYLTGPIIPSSRPISRLCSLPSLTMPVIYVIDTDNVPTANESESPSRSVSTTSTFLDTHRDAL